MLSDFASYGEFILQAKSGNYVYVSLFDNLSLSDIVQTILEEIKEYKGLPGHKQIDIFQEAIAKCADPIKTYSLSKNCPICGSKQIAYGDDIPVEDRDIPKATFTEFHVLGKDEKKELLREMILSFRTQNWI